MRTTIFTLLAVGVILFTTQVKATETTDNLLLSETPEGWVLVEEDVLFVLVTEPAGYFEDARSDFLNGDLKDAGENMRMAVALIKLEISRSTGDVKKSLVTSVKELKKLIKKVEKGEVVAGETLDKAFARAEYALAWHHFQKAKEYQSREKYGKMARSIDAAVTHLLYASSWTDDNLEKDDVAAAKDARSFAKKVMDGVASAPAKAGEVLKSVGQSLKKLGTSLDKEKEEDSEDAEE